MAVFLKVLLALIIIAYAAIQFLVAHWLSTQEMRGRFVRGQNLVGAIFANVFYAPAWILKGIRYVFTTLILG